MPETEGICGVTKHATYESEQVFRKSARNLVEVLSGSYPHPGTLDFWKIPPAAPRCVPMSDMAAETHSAVTLASLLGHLSHWEDRASWFLASTDDQG